MCHRPMVTNIKQVAYVIGIALGAVTAAVLLLALCSSFTPAAAQSPTAGENPQANIVRSPEQTSGRDTRSSGFVWTEEEMRKAIPVSMENSTKDLSDLPAVPSNGPAGWTPSVAPKNGILQSQSAGAIQSLDGDSTFYNPYDYTTFPFSAVGKVFFTRGGRNYVCSGAVIANNAVWTAGHCVHSGGGKPSDWVTNWTFVPAFKDFAVPFGSWPAAYMYTTDQWIQTNDVRYDYAVVIVKPSNGDNAGMTIGDVVGSLGFAYNQPLQQFRVAMGYPVPIYGGQKQVISVASTVYTDTAYADPSPIGIPSLMNNGASGGPWMINFFPAQVGDANIMNGNNSYIHLTGENIVYSPYFGDEAKALYDCAVQSTPDQKACGNEADLVLTQQASSRVIAIGDPLSYTLAIYNQGALTATNVVITDVLPASVTYQAADIPGGLCAAAGGGGADMVVTCTLDTLPRWSSISATLAITAPLQTGVVTSTASVTSDQADNTPSDNLAVQLKVMVENCAALVNDEAATYPSVQEAIDAAQEGDVVKVAGVCGQLDQRQAPDYYYLDPAYPFNVTQVAYIDKSLTVQGGYTFTNWLDADPLANPTSLDAWGQGRALFIAGPGITVTVEGLTLIHGDATGLSGDSQDLSIDAGGGGYVISSTLVLSNTTVTQNLASRYSTFSDGGGLYLSNSSGSILDNNRFTGNLTIGNGGGINIYNSDNVSVTRNTFAGNISRSFFGCGAGLYLGGSRDDFVSRNTFTGNASSMTGGGMCLIDSASPIISDNAFRNNQAQVFVTGIYLGNGGGIILMQVSNATLNRNTLTGNSAGTYGGGLDLEKAKNIHLINTVIDGNHAISAGSGVAALGSTFDLLHTTLVNNTGNSAIWLDQYSDTDGALYNTVTLTNTIMVSQTVGVAVNDGSSLHINDILWYTTPVTVSATTSATVSVSNQITADPLFVDQPNGDYHLQKGSPAINRGVRLPLMGDHDGTPRDAWPDLGAFEYPPFRMLFPFFGG